MDGEFPPGHSIVPNLRMWQVAEREGRADAPQYLDAALAQAQWIVDNVDSNSTWLTFYRIDPAGGNAVVYRASKPSGETINAKAIIMDADNLPIVLSASNASAWARSTTA